MAIEPQTDVRTCAQTFLARITRELEDAAWRAGAPRAKAREAALAEVQADRAAFQKRASEVAAYADRARSLTAEQAAAAALAMERAYTALESILERVTFALEGWVPSGPEWQRELLDGAAMSIHKVRPALLSRLSHEVADRLMRFRHFLHHAYRADLDPCRVGELVAELALGQAFIVADLDALEAFLASMADELGS
jgi:hypothetical protein